ncbi:MAG: hypothetical protein JSV56_09820, partial [Methanomassiliicoccales archaeon]
MIHRKKGRKRHIEESNGFYSAFVAFLFIFFFLMFLSSFGADAAPPVAIIEDSAPEFINESSEPVCVLNLTLTDDDGAQLDNMTITVQNATGNFDPNTDLAPLDWDNSSGIMIYEESNAQAGFQPDDSPIGIMPIGWGGGGPWVTTFYAIYQTLPISTTGPNYYVVIRTSASISNGASFIVGIQANNIWTNQSSIPSSSNWSKVITADTIAPTPIVAVFSENPVAKVGDWVNITASITDDDATFVTVNLSAFNGLSNAEPMIYESGNKIWFYNITALMEGSVDTGVLGYAFEVSAVDKVGKSALASNWTKPIDTKSPVVAVIVNHESVPAGIGEWINITAATGDTDVTGMNVDLASAGFTGQTDDQPMTWSGSDWYYNFTISPGTIDASTGISVNVDAVDDAGNSGNGTDVAFWDEIAPTVNVIVTSQSLPAGIGQWINITATTSADAVNVMGDLSAFSGKGASEIFSGSGTNWYYNFSVQPGTLEGQGYINVTVIDDAGNLNFNDSQTADVDEVVPTVTLVEFSHTLIVEANVGEIFYLNITFSENMDTGTAPTILFVNPTLIGTLTFSGGAWDGTTIYRAQYMIYDSNEEQLDVDIEVTNAEDVAGNIQAINLTSNAFDVDTVSPSVLVMIAQESTPCGIGQWINITVTTDADAQAVNADLASAGFTDQNDDQLLIKINSTSWYYTLTISPGVTDASGGVLINVDITDNVGNLNSSSGTAFFDEVYPEPLNVMVISAGAGTYPAKIGDWINITVDVGGHLDIQTMYVSALGVFSSEPITEHIGNIWYLNTTLPSGTADGLVPFVITVIDDANNLNDTAYYSADVDNVYPDPLGVIILTSSQPAKVGDWMNLTVDLDGHLDVDSILLDAPGIFSSEPITHRIGNLWYLNTSIPIGTADGQVTFTVTLMDDAGNLITTSSLSQVDNQPPTIAVIESISDGIHTTPETVFKGTLTIYARTDSVDILKVSFYDGDPKGAGILIGDDFDSPYSVDWITTIADDGEHRIFVRVFDDAGNFLDSSQLVITIDNFNDLPIPIIGWANRV